MSNDPNLPYCVATLLLEGDAFVEQFAEAALADTARMELADRVLVVEDPAITQRGSRYRRMVHVVVRLRDGTMLEEAVEAPRGSERSFASSEDVIENFMKLVMWRIPSAQAAGIVEQVMALERLDGLDDFIRLLGARVKDPSAAG